MRNALVGPCFIAILPPNDELHRSILISVSPAHSVNLFHNSGCPLNARQNQLVRTRTPSWPSEQIVRGLHMQASQNCGHYPKDPFTAFVHRETIPRSPCVRQKQFGILCLMEITVSLNDADLFARLKNFEDHFVERKTSGDNRDFVKTAVAFANSAPNGYPCVLYLGVKNNGEIETPQVNLDTLQKTFNQMMKNAYPPVPYLDKDRHNDGGRQALAIIVFGSELRPHFAGLAYVRKGSESINASEQQFEELIAQKNSKAARILQFKGKSITVFVRSEDSEIPWPKSTTLVECDQFYVTVQAVPHEPPSSFPLNRVEINFDNLRKTLQLEITDPNRNAWEVELERSARQVLGHRMTHGGRHAAVRWLMMHERVGCQVQFMPEISLEDQNKQMDVAVEYGFIRRKYEPSGGVHPLCFYVFNPEYLPVLKRVLPEFLSPA